ncbi:hypothetical protein CSC79_16100 [Pseudoalteromonas sp. 3D05]|nr:hypothetical protein CSC79_16100 [Pseudoalteromonas sp. 3D05]
MKDKFESGLTKQEIWHNSCFVFYVLQMLERFEWIFGASALQSFYSAFVNTPLDKGAFYFKSIN